MLNKSNLIDDIVEITDEEAVKMTKRLWREEGLYSGVSSGANVLAALREAEKFKECRVVTVLPDSGDRYMTDIHYIT